MNGAGAVLALDLATTTGWALHRRGMPRPFFGAFRLPGDAKSVGEPCLALELWLIDLIERLAASGDPLTHIFFEAQHVGAKINIDTVYRLIGLGATIEKVAHQQGCARRAPKIHCYKVLIQEWRKHFIGRGAGFRRDPATKRYLPGEDPKELAIQQCARYGWHTDIADAAEACGILDFALAEMDRGCRNAGLPGYARPWRDALMIGGAA